MSRKSPFRLRPVILKCLRPITTSLHRIVVLFFILFLALVGLRLSSPSSVASGQVESTCSDSDGGLNYEVAGYVEGIGPNGWPVTKYDICETGDREGQVREFYCNGLTPWPMFYQCPNGCVEGACSTEPVTCIDADADGYAQEGGACGLQDCDDSNPAVNPGASEVCDNGIDDDCDNTVDADDSDCNDPPLCFDSDGGLNYEVAGYVEGIGPNGWPVTRNDVCETGDREGQLREFYCLDTTPWPKFYQCPLGCQEAACISEPDTCTDADGDGYAIEGGVCGLVDCDDNNPQVSPGALEVCDNGIDDDCNGLIDDGCNQPPAQYTDCSQSSFGTYLIKTNPDDWITPASVLIYANDEIGIKGLVGTGAMDSIVRDDWFGRLPGWTRSFMKGTFPELEKIHPSAIVFGMQDMYECIGYGPESAHRAGEEALDPLYWVPQAETLAENVGKCLNYGPAVQDYEDMATPVGEDQPREDLLAGLIAGVAPHVDIWMIQLAKYQIWTEKGHDNLGNPYGMEDFENWITWWVTQIKSANPETKVWTQLGIGKFDPILKECLPPQPVENILDFREALISAGVDGVWVVPSQTCQPCPPEPPPGFICSTDPQDNEYYLQSLVVFQQAIEIACASSSEVHKPVIINANQ